jgi:aspartyl-tRNA(Asn)/glutamyl-tRNA(Gln) amidotransferase subunit A
MIDLKNLTIEQAHRDMKSGVYTPTVLVNEYLDVIKQKNSDINAYLEIYPDVLEQAKAAEEMFANGTATMMTGIPVSLKDNMLRDEYTASASSKILENYTATYSASVVSQLKDAGAVFIGRTNMDEFAMGSSTETSAFGITKNPLDTSCVPGGSSGGAVASVAMDGALCALGSDTGGSIRQPAAFTNLVGLKPTYGAVSRYGIISMGSSLDQVGPIAKNVSDCEILFNSINAHDKNDGTSVPVENRIKSSSLKKKIGIPREFLKGDGIDATVLENFDQSCEKLKNAGYELIDINLPMLKYSLPVYYILMPAEVSSNLARYDGIRYGESHAGGKLFDTYAMTRGQGFGKEVRRRIILGTYILSHGYYDAYYNSAVKIRNAIKNELQNAFKDVDAIITPTTPTPPFKFGSKSKDPVAMYLSDIFLAPANIAGVPAISIPAGFTPDSLPLGLHIMAPFHREDILFTIGKDFEREVLSR